MAILLPIAVVLATLSLGLSGSVLTVPNGQQWGEWKSTEYCPAQFYAVGFSLRVKTMYCVCQFTDCEFVRVWFKCLSVMESIQLCIEVTHITIWINFMLACVSLLSGGRYTGSWG